MSAARVGSGLVDVFATPMLVALVEQTCYESVLPHLDEGQGTVGTLVNVSHLSATPIGKRVWCNSELTEVDGLHFRPATLTFGVKYRLGFKRGVPSARPTPLGEPTK